MKNILQLIVRLIYYYPVIIIKLLKYIVRYLEVLSMPDYVDNDPMVPYLKKALFAVLSARINKGIKSQDLIGLKCISFLLLLIAPQSQESRTLTLHHSKQYLPILK